jgi:hypothetical protein
MILIALFADVSDQTIYATAVTFKTIALAGVAAGGAALYYITQSWRAIIPALIMFVMIAAFSIGGNNAINAIICLAAMIAMLGTRRFEEKSYIDARVKDILETRMSPDGRSLTEQEAIEYADFVRALHKYGFL